MKKFKTLKNPMDFAVKIMKENNSIVDVPIGCVIVNNKNKLISFANNESISKKDPTAHAELTAIRRACSVLNSNFLENCSLYVTLEPCKMCQAAIFESRIQKVFFGAYNYKNTFESQKKKYFFEKNNFQYYGGFSESECSKYLKSFFKKIRGEKLL